MQKAFESNNEKIKVTSLDIVVTGTKAKPYFEIKYKEVGKEDYNIGYSSYDLNNVFGWKEECFQLVEEKDEKAFEDIVERLDYLLNHFGEHCEEWGSDKEDDCHRKSCSDCVLEHAIEIVNQVAEEYKSTEHINCSSDSSTEEVCEWKRNDMTMLYETSCDNLEQFVNYGYKYCPYCGKKIKVVE